MCSLEDVGQGLPTPAPLLFAPDCRLSLVAVDKLPGLSEFHFFFPVEQNSFDCACVDVVIVNSDLVISSLKPGTRSPVPAPSNPKECLSLTSTPRASWLDSAESSHLGTIFPSSFAFLCA